MVKVRANVRIMVEVDWLGLCLVLLRCHFSQGRSVSVGVSMKKMVVGLGFGVYTRAPYATVRFP